MGAMAEAPKFVLFVQSVEGRVFTYFPTGTYIGVHRATPVELEAGKAPLTWDTKAVTPITEADYARYRKEFDGAIRRGDLKRADEKAWKAWADGEAKRAETEAAELQAKAKAAAGEASKTSKSDEGKSKEN